MKYNEAMKTDDKKQWEEAVKKESRGRILNENFDFNPKNLLVITDKPTSVNKMGSGNVKEENKESMDALKIEYETGAISNEEMYQRTAVLSGYHGSQEHFEQSWEDIFEENAPMVDFLRNLQTRGIPRYLLSNSNDLHVRHVETAYAVLEPFNDIIFSHQAKAMKPDEMIFEKAIAQFGLEPSKTAYIDDLADNIATGRRLGFQCIHYNPDAHDVAKNELRALGLITT